jgi:hypothetical protein
VPGASTPRKRAWTLFASVGGELSSHAPVGGRVHPVTDALPWRLGRGAASVCGTIAETALLASLVDLSRIAI